MTTVAMLGTGTMGAAMARNLIGKGFVVQAWNRTPARAEQITGATVASTPADAVRGAEVIVTILTDGPTVAGVITEAAPGLAAGQVWAQMSTVGVKATSELVELAAAHGLAYVDAPVLGTRQPAEAGALTVLAAGAPEVRPLVDPVFDAVGSRTVWLADDPAGAAATRLKLVANTWVLVSSSRAPRRFSDWRAASVPNRSSSSTSSPAAPWTTPTCGRSPRRYSPRTSRQTSPQPTRPRTAG